MRLVYLLLVVAAAATVPPISSASTIDLSWDPCASIVAERPAGKVVNLYVTVTGHSTPHMAYQFRVLAYDDSGDVPDAWRFDLEGCQGTSRIAIEEVPLPDCASCCPAFQGEIGTMTIKWAKPAASGPPGLDLLLARAYTDGNDVTIQPSARYALGQIVFDHAASVSGEGTPGVSCGGFERAMTLALVPASCQWIEHAASVGGEINFTIGQGSVRIQGGGSEFVAATPATWGAIKSVYRR